MSVFFNRKLFSEAFLGELVGEEREKQNALADSFFRQDEFSPHPYFDFEEAPELSDGDILSITLVISF